MTDVTIESLTEELDKIREHAMGSKQFAAAVAATEAKAFLHGLMPKKYGDDFVHRLVTLIAKIRAGQGDAAADKVKEILLDGLIIDVYGQKN
jgi:hypothetical protein